MKSSSMRPSFEQQPFSPELPNNGGIAIRIALYTEDTDNEKSSCILTGSYRSPDDLLLDSRSALRNLAIVAVIHNGFLPLVDMLSDACLDEAPADITTGGMRQGYFTVSTEYLFDLSNLASRFSLVCSILNLTSNVIVFDSPCA